jgi:acetyltransferase-like isoleucine patch superfamily enzyme
MANDNRTKMIPGRTPESAAMLANVKRAMAITANLNRLTFNDADEVRALFSELIGKKVDDSFLLIPPFYTTGGAEIRIGRNVFVNQNCTFYDLGGLDIADDVMIGPNVSIVTSGHPVEPSRRRAFTIAKPIVIERNVWIAAGATVIGGVTVPPIRLSEETRRGSFVRSPTEGTTFLRLSKLPDFQAVQYVDLRPPVWHTTAPSAATCSTGRFRPSYGPKDGFSMSRPHPPRSTLRAARDRSGTFGTSLALQ